MKKKEGIYVIIVDMEKEKNNGIKIRKIRKMMKNEKKEVLLENIRVKI